MTIFEIQGGVSVRVGRDIPEVTNMSFWAFGPCMRFHRRVEVRPSSQAVFGPDTKLVNVKAMLTWREPGNLSVDVNSFAVMGKRYPAFDIASLGWEQNSNGFGN